MNTKEKIHQLIDDCSNDVTLEEVYLMLSMNEKADWWDELNEEEQKKTLVSLEQSESGKTLSHKDVMNNLWTKFGI